LWDGINLWTICAVSAMHKASPTNDICESGGISHLLTRD
jgi:hypothetical protein